MGASFRQLDLQPEKGIEDINKDQLIKKHDRSVSVSNDGNEHMIIVSQIQKNDRVRKKVCVGASFRLVEHCCYLHPEKSIKNMNKYQLIKNHDRVVSVADDANENMIIVSQIKKNDMVKKKVCVG